MQHPKTQALYVIVYAKDDGCFYSLTLKLPTLREQRKLNNSTIFSTGEANKTTSFSVFVDGISYRVSRKSKIHDLKKRILKTGTAYETVQEFDLYLNSGAIVDDMYIGDMSDGTLLNIRPHSSSPEDLETVAAQKSLLTFATFPRLDTSTRKWGFVTYHVDVRQLVSLVNMETIEDIQKGIEHVIARKARGKFVDYEPSLQGRRQHWKLYGYMAVYHSIRYDLEGRKQCD
jgi:hypothetical protein